jgi:hypothetical protein
MIVVSISFLIGIHQGFNCVTIQNPQSDDDDTRTPSKFTASVVPPSQIKQVVFWLSLQDAETNRFQKKLLRVKTTIWMEASQGQERLRSCSSEAEFVSKRSVKDRQRSRPGSSIVQRSTAAFVLGNWPSLEFTSFPGQIFLSSRPQPDRTDDL